ncbi:MAG TPA: FAD-dependent oxidoreductase [Planctomycetota bacterium]|nr:FAD-dependent oxidoreductase [Planctomycetota bacterium]
MSTLPERVEVLVVGLGIQGAGVLQAAAAAGHSALALEERAPAAGTSSRSSKLIHGGLRYLESGQFALVRESLAERAILLEIAPHLVHLVEFLIPIYRTTRRRPWEIRAGLSLYAVLGGLVREARFARVPRAEWDALDGLSTQGLQAVFRYHDGQTDDAALVRAVVASARELGAEVACPARLVGARRAGEGWRARVALDGAERELDCSVLVVSAGPWASAVQREIEGSPEPPAVELVGGAHVELTGTLERGIYYVEAPGDGRAVFAMPWKGHTLVGTTETPYSGDPALVAPLPSEIDYLCETFAAHFPGRAVELLDSWAGLRVLPRGTGRAFSRPREVVLSIDDELSPRFVGLYGGKLTGYRATAERVLERLAASLPLAARRADTSTLRLPSVG